MHNAITDTMPVIPSNISNHYLQWYCDSVQIM